METREVEIDGVTQSSSVHIKRCRYLAESGCAGMCINLCKSPTQVRAARGSARGLPPCVPPAGGVHRPVACARHTLMVCISGCLCLPLQTFFNEQLGMPLSMEPNFEDYSCDMVFGKRPLPRGEDPAFTQGCLALCTTAQAANKANAPDKTCYKLE